MEHDSSGLSPEIKQNILLCAQKIFAEIKNGDTKNISSGEVGGCKEAFTKGDINNLDNKVSYLFENLFYLGIKDDTLGNE